MTSEITLERGDVVLIYTDGLSEARRGDRFLGEDALIAVLEAARGESAEAIGKRLGDLLASPGVDVRDDAAALVLRAV
jgi:serine phosphatase RsbU (regulator of sigma subunit)